MGSLDRELRDMAALRALRRETPLAQWTQEMRDDWDESVRGCEYAEQEQLRDGPDLDLVERWRSGAVSPRATGHMQDRAVPDGVPDVLRVMWSDSEAREAFLEKVMWSDSEALEAFVERGVLPPVVRAIADRQPAGAPLGVAPNPGHPAAPPQPVAQLAPAHVLTRPDAHPARGAQPPAAPALPGPDAQPAYAPAAEAAHPAAAPAAALGPDAALLREVEALRTRCAELEPRIEKLELRRVTTRQLADSFLIAARLQALETLMYRPGG